MSFIVVLDACVLYPASVCDALLRLAAAEFYEFRWSRRILDELERNLALSATDAAGARRRRDAMAESFDGAEVDAFAIEHLESAMTNHPKDRHVLAAAVAGSAQAVITFNLKDFPATSTEPFAIDVLHPDAFLMTLFALNPGLTTDLVCEQAAALRDPPLSVEDVVVALAKSVPSFAASVQGELSGRDDPTEPRPSER